MRDDSILEAVILHVIAGKNDEFEATFNVASKIISSISGYINHELRPCIENPNQYLLLVWWETLEAHTINFRQSEQYQEWRSLLHKFYEPFPSALHYKQSII